MRRVAALFTGEEELAYCPGVPTWTKVESVFDSEDAESVAPRGLAPWIVTSESDGSKRGHTYLSASGNRSLESQAVVERVDRILRGRASGSCETKTWCHACKTQKDNDDGARDESRSVSGSESEEVGQGEVTAVQMKQMRMKVVFGSESDMEEKSHVEAPRSEDAAVDSGSEEGRDV